MALSTISAVGTLVKNSGAKTLSVSPHAVGNVMILGTDCDNSSTSNTVSVSGVTGGGCTGWTNLVGPLKDTAVDSFEEMNIWMGTVTASGSSTITVTTSGTGTLSASSIFLIAQEFTSTGGSGTTWTQDGSGATLHNTTSSTTVIFPTLTPSGPQRCYVGYSTTAQVGKTTGATTGYTAELDSANSIFLYNPSVSTVQSPTGVQGTSSGKSDTLAALFYATIPSTNQFMPFFGL